MDDKPQEKQSYVSSTTNDQVREVDQKNFETLKRAFVHGDVGLVRVRHNRTGEYATAICTFEPHQGGVAVLPFALMFETSPFEDYAPPEGGETVDVTGVQHVVVEP